MFNKKTILMRFLWFIFGAILVACLGTYIFSRTDKSNRTYLAPASEGSSFVSFFALGDQGSGSYRQARVAAIMEDVCMASGKINFTLLLGDNFYMEGVRSVDDGNWDRLFESAYSTPCLAGMPFYAALGNHGYKGEPLAQIEYSRRRLGSHRWHMPDNYYVKDFGMSPGRALIRLVVLDTILPMDKQNELIRSAFENADASVWKMVAGHIPVRSFGAMYGENAGLINDLLPALKKYKVDLYLSGHSHNLQLIERKAEPVYIISGAGGKRPRKLVNDSTGELMYGEEKLGFVKIEVSVEAIGIEFISIDSGYFASSDVEHRKFTLTPGCAYNRDAVNCLRQ